MDPSLNKKPWLELPEAEQTIVLDKARALIDGIESGHADDVTRVLDELTSIRESHLFQGLGRLTRQLHEVLTSLERETVLARLADTQLPAAKERLNYVMAKSEEATHETLTAIEDTVPIANALGARAKQLGQACSPLVQGDVPLPELPVPIAEILRYFDIVAEDTAKIGNNLSKVLIAQEAQDLTGQVIRRVIELVQDLESQLVGFMAAYGDVNPRTPTSPSPTPAKLEGPQFKPGPNPEVVASQDEVDDLLSSLGF